MPTHRTRARGKIVKVIIEFDAETIDACENRGEFIRTAVAWYIAEQKRMALEAMLEQGYREMPEWAKRET